MHPNLDPSALPRHVAIIMDGNGRWAKKHRLKVALGHQAGTEALRGIIRDSSDIGINTLSLYAFSTENWTRPQAEVDALMALVLKFFASEIDELVEKNVRIRILGDVDGMPAQQAAVLREAMRRTEGNTGLNLCIALNYGGRAELARAVRQISAEVKDGALSVDQISEQTLADHLYTAGLPDVDLLIRTSGEMRVSNFMLYQISYAEFAFPHTLWPDFDTKAYHQCLEAFARRDRRYGGRREQPSR